MSARVLKWQIIANVDEEDGVTRTGGVHVWVHLTPERGQEMGQFPSVEAAIAAFPARWRIFTEDEQQDVEITDTPDLLAECWRGAS